MRKRDLGILIICAFAILWSFRGEQGEYYFNESWQQPIDTTQYTNLHFPLKYEKIPKPLVTDLDGDGLNEIVYTTRDCTIKVIDVTPSSMSTRSAPLVKAQSTLLNKIGVRTGRRPVGLGSGYLKRSQDSPAQQVIVVITEGWIVMCFDHNLELLWENSPVDEVPEGLYHEEVAIMVAPHPVRVGDEGIVVVGGRLAPIDSGKGIEHEHATDHIGPEGKIEREAEGHHFSYYAFDGKSGGLRWKHEEGDFFAIDPHGAEEEEVETFMPAHSFKQHVFSQARHLGEVDWRQYKHHVLSHLPYRWVDGFDTYFVLDRFTKKTNFGRNPASASTTDNTEWNPEAIGIPNPLASSTQQNTNRISPKSDVDKPNVLVATVKGGLEIVHLFTGRPLCRLMLPSLQAAASYGAYADVNSDEIIDQVLSVINAEGEKQRCLAIATAGVPPIEQLWNGSICHVGGALETLVVKGFKFANAFGTIAPSFLPSATSAGLDSVFVVSSGKVTAFGPTGNRLWSINTQAGWTHNANSNTWNYPVLLPIQILPGDSTFHMLAIGGSMVLISPQGTVITNVVLRRPLTSHTIASIPDIAPVAPPVLGDFNNDGITDVVIVAHNGFYGFAIQKGSGSVLFPALIIVLICVMIYALMRAEGGFGEFDKRGGGIPRKRALD